MTLSDQTIQAVSSLRDDDHPSANDNCQFAFANSSAADPPPQPAAPPRRPATPPPQPAGANGWTILLIAIGVSVIACCLLVPQANENRSLLYQCEKLKVGLDHIKMQARTNQEFINQIGHDPALAERLAQRQMRLIRKGASVLDLPELASSDADRSPFVLVTVPHPPPMPDYGPVKGLLSDFFADVKTRLYLIGAGLMLTATGLILGHSPKPSRSPSSPA